MGCNKLCIIQKLVVFVCFFLSVSCIAKEASTELSLTEIKSEISDIDSNIVDFQDTSLSEIKYRNESVEDCNCGENSTKCEIKDGLKICTCKQGYVPGINEMCTEMCDDTHKCINGGTCFNGVCLCPPRTKGTFCEEVYVVCWTTGYQRKFEYRGLNCCCKENATAECLYDVKKYDAYCKCPNEGDVYDDDSNTCKECNCGKPETWTKCDFYNGVKTCFCNKNYEYNLKTKTCEPCNCGNNSKKCEFSWNGNIKCNCKKGYQQWDNKCLDCNCGESGFCELREGKPICHCDEGFKEWKGICKECDCGKFGECILDNIGGKLKCDCDTGYADVEGKCKYCYCGDDSVCTFGLKKKCKCPTGYEDINGFCTDIDECTKSNPCPAKEKCINLPGSYVCGCADGYVHTTSGCSDINECEIDNKCGAADAECVNTEGSYECRCKSGLRSLGGTKKFLICENDTSYKAGFGILVALLVSLGFWLIFYRKCM